MKKFIALSLVFAAVITSSACKQSGPPEASISSSGPPAALSSNATEQPPAGEETIVFTDSCKRDVILPKNLTRVAPSGPAAQMVLYSLAPDKMIGWGTRPSQDVIGYYTPSAAALPEFGQFYGKNATLNMEALIAADPQVIIDIGDMKPTHKEDMDALQKQIGIPVIFVEANMDSFPLAYRTLGNLLNENKQGEAIAAYIETTLAEAQRITEQIPANERLSVFFGTGPTGLDANARGSIHADVIELVGAVNAVVVPELSNKGGGNTINMEQLMVFDPDVVLLAAGGPYSELSGDPLWGNLRAVKNDQFYEIPFGPYHWFGSPPSVNRIIGIRWLGNLLYPSRFDYDMMEEEKEFYRLFWHYDLSDDEAEKILTNSTLKAQKANS